ncbi:MAG: circadian clock protein KaiC, partial [Pseudomonadota bacterium]|nr:circadian clock protein KaiC [Pseudomonadota bacterium]
PHRLYLLEGTPGSGKSTFALRFLMAGVERQEKGLYITLSETAAELQAVVASHGWSLVGIDLCELVDESGRDPDAEQSILHPSEIELGETIRKITARVEAAAPIRVVFDSLSEMRLLAQDPLRYRRQVLALKQFFSTRACTVLLLDDKTSEPGDLQLHSISHGVISLEQVIQQYGTESRRLRVVKMRGQKFQGGQHDFLLDTGRVAVFPRLVASQHRDVAGGREGFVGTRFAKPVETEIHEQVGTGSEGFDAILGGGLRRGTSTLLLGPSGVGKTSSAVSFMHAALCRGERCTYYLFDEGMPTLLLRSRQLGMDLAPFVEAGTCRLVQIDPADMSSGEFSARVVDAVSRDGSSFLALDSLNAYLQAMPGQNFLLLHMHELLTYLNHRNVTTVLVVGQHGAVGQVSGDIDLSYLSDATLMFRFFEAEGAMRSAVTALKSRTAFNERTIREFRITREAGLQVGEPLVAFEGVLGGLPSYRGTTRMLVDGATGGAGSAVPGRASDVAAIPQSLVADDT